MTVKNKLSRITLFRIKRCVRDFNFDDITFAPNLEDPLNKYDIRFYRKRHIIFKLTMVDNRCYTCSNVRKQLKEYFKLDTIYYI